MSTKTPNSQTGAAFSAAFRLFVLVSAGLLSLPAFAVPIAVDDNVAVPSNTTVFANDLAANDTVLPTDTFAITIPPAHGTATLTTNGLLDYTPNIGFANLDTLTYSVDDGAGGMATATVTFDVVLTSDFLTPGNTFLIGQEDIPTPLNLSVDPSLEFGGTLQDVIGVDALYRTEAQIGVPIASTIPLGTTGINITGYATRNVGTTQNDGYNDDYELLSININLRDGNYSGRLTYSIAPNQGGGTIDQYTWLNIPLGQSVLSDTSYVTGNWTGAADPLIELVAGQIRITETIPLQIAYHIEYMTSDGDSADFVSGSGDVQTPNDSQSTFSIPPELEPTDGSKLGYLVLTGNSAANGAHFAEEHKGFSRLVIDLEASSASGVIASERGELDSLVTTWSFTDYPLIDIRNTPGATPVSITASSATRVGDDSAAGTGTATGVGIEDDPTIYIDASGDLIVERAIDHAAAFTTMFTIENYQRTGLSSIASFVGVESDTSLFDSNPPDGVDENGKPVNLQTFEIPASSSIGIVQMSWQTIGGNATNENVGYGFTVIDLNDNTSSGSITFSRATTPDLVAWQGVPIGTTMFGATSGGVALYQSNKAAGAFTDDYAETARFTIINNADGSRTMEFSASSMAGTGTFADYIGTAQVSWLGSEPFRVEGVPLNGYLSHGSPTSDGGWEVDFAEIPLLSISTNEHGTGILQLGLVLSSTGELDTISVHVEPVVDGPTLIANDVVGYIGNPAALGLGVTDSADVDGSETQLQTLTLSGVPASVTLAATAGTVTNFGGGNWEVDEAALATLNATSPTNTTATVAVSGTNTDTDDIDGDGVIEDTNNGAGVDELDSVVYTDTFKLTIRNVPTVTSQSTNTGTPVISGSAVVGTGETLQVTVNGITYTAGDGNLVDNGDGTWDLTVPASDTIADGTYFVTASLNHVDGGIGSDTTADELVIDTAPPAIPTATPLNTSDTTPTLSGTATVGPGETLNVHVDGITYTAGDGNLVDNGDGTWTLAISAPVAEGTYDVTATVTDTAGNISVDTSTSELVVLATPLSTPTVVSLTTSNTTPVITGSAIVGAGETFTVTIDGVTYTNGDGNLVYNSSGTWTLSIPTAMADGTYEVIATVTDVFGNLYPDTSSNELIIDTTSPVTPTVTSQTTNNTTPVISGTATVGLDETLSVTVDGVTYTAGDGNLVDHGDGTWDLTISTPMPEATYSITTTITDAAGNSATDSSANELTIDSTPPSIPTVTSQVTSNTTPTISGTASIDAGETLTVSVGGVTYFAGDGFLNDNGDGTWDLNVPTALADGSYSVTATIIDAAGNASDDATSLELTIDTTPPVTPTVTSQNTNNTTPTITGTATVTPDDVLSVVVDGVTYTAGDGYLVDNADGTWALSIPVPLAQGTYDVLTTVTDPAGNATSDTTAGELIIDLTAPIAPGVTSLATTDSTPAIEGTATLAPGEILTVEVDGVVYTAGDGDLVDNGDGTWALTIPATNILAENLYQVVAKVTDAAGNSAIDPGVDDLVVDFTAPSTPGVTSQTTNDTTPIINGTATIIPGETLTVEINGTTYTAGDGNLVDNGDGTWALSIPIPIVEGLYNVTATITDAAGNHSTDPSSGELLIDTTLPLTPTVTPQFTIDTTPVISGTANPGPGETLTVTVDGATYTVGDGNLVDNGDGTWDLNIPTVMAEGTYEVTTSIADAAGNISIDTNSNELVIDITDPVTPTVNALITNVNTPVLTGTASTATWETLTVTVDGITYTAGDGNLVLNADGTWDLTLPPANILADGTYEVIAVITDLAGNSSSDITTNELIVDTAPPVIPTVAAQTTNNTTPIISGTATVASGETLTVTIDGVTYTAGDGNLVDNGDGTWELSVPNSLADSTYPVTVSVMDAANNASIDVTTAELIIDTTPPVAPTVVSKTTSNPAPAITGTATVGTGESLTVTVDGTIYSAGDGTLVDNGNGTWILNVPTPMADNNYEVIATIVDAAGNSTDDVTTLELTIDTTAPVIPTVTALLTNNATPIIQGTATVGAGETLSVLVGGISYTAGDGFLVDNGDGTWDLQVSVPLADSTYEVVATATDVAGNTSVDISANELVVDTTPPATPTVVSQNTNNNSPTITGTASVALGDTLTVTVDGTTYTAGDGFLVDNGDGTWSLAIPAPLAEGIYDVTTTVTDPAGNVAADTTAGELTIDLTAPVAPGVTSQATSDTTPIIEGTAIIGTGEILSVEVNGTTYIAGDGNLVNNGDGTWTLTIPAADTLAENLYQVIATVTDAASNSVTDPGVDDLLVDVTAPSTPGVTSQTTNNTTPIIEGTATVAAGETLTIEVNGVTYTAGDGNLVDNGDGTWVLTIPTPLVEGLYNVTASITDSAGNLSTDPSSGELLIDTTLPITPTVTPLITNDTTPVISGTANAGPGETLTVSVDGVTYTAGDGNLVDNGDGTWDLSLPTALAEGTYEVEATVTDAAGNVSTDTSSNELVIDTTVPMAPTVDALITNVNTPVLAGTTSTVPGETLTVTVDGMTYTAGDGNLINNGDGTWNLTIPLASALTDGTYEVIATITDLAGNTNTDATVNELIVDTVAPVIPTVTAQTTNNSTPAISGTATVAPGETLTVTVDGVTYTAADGNLVDNGDGTWDLTIPTPLADSTYPVLVSVLDAAGNNSFDATTAELVIDTVPPVAPTVAAQTTSNTTPMIIGTATVGAGEILTVNVDGITYTAGDGNLVDNGDGTWVLSPVAPLADGLYDVIATVTDGAGNITTDATVAELVIDTIAPVLPTVSSQSTNDNTPLISGTATVVSGETLTVNVDGVTYTAGDGNLVDNGDGTWDLNVPTPMSDNTYAVTVSVVDAAGNTSIDSSTAELVVDTILPVTPSVISQETNNTTPLLEGTATVAAGETLTISVNGTTYTAGDGFLVDNGDGSWALSVPVPLAEGTYDVTATVSDSAGNVVSDISTVELTIDLTAPIAPGVTSQATSDTTPVIAGTATIGSGETLSVEVNGVTYTAGDGNLVNNGDGTWALTIPVSDTLPESLYEVVATITDAAGNSATDPGVDDLLIDLTAPNTPGVTSQTTNDTSPIISGTATVAPGETLIVEVDGVIYTAGDGNLIDYGNGTWTLSIPVPLAEGLYDVTATITDSAGNSSTDSSSGELLIDTTLPVTPTATPLTTNDTTPVISGTANAGPGETLTVTIDGVTYTAGDGNLIDNGDGTWDLSVATALTEGTYEVVTTVTDAAGNVSVDTSGNELVIDTTTPVVPTVSAQTTNTDTPVISGTAVLIPGETMTVAVNGIIYTAGDGNLVVNSDGTWNLTIPAANALDDGVYSVTATITDAAGNSITDATVSELIIDTVAPAVPTVIPQNTNNGTPVITGTATIAPGETLSVSVDGVAYIAGEGNLVNNGDGTWVLTITNPLSANTYPVGVTVLDAAGNATIDTTTDELIIDITAPVAPGVTSLTTADTTPVIEGIATIGNGETLSVQVNGITYINGDGNLIDNGDGTWSLTIPAPNALAENLYQVIATVTDVAGNSSIDAGVDDLLIDVTAPNAPGVTSQTTNDSTPIISGTALAGPGETLTVTVDGVTYTSGDGFLADNGDGTWTLSMTNPLDEGVYDVSVTITDTAGNISSDSGSSDLLIDTTLPDAPTATPLTTNNNMPVISGTANPAPGETLTVTVNGVTYTAGDGNLVDNDDGTWTLSLPNALPDGNYDVIATITDEAGNSVSDTGSSELVVDTTPPITPTADSLNTDDTTPILTGTAVLNAGETLSVTVNGVTYTAGDGNLIHNADGSWTLNLPTEFSEGDYPVQATVIDAAGNTTVSSLAQLVVRAAAPEADFDADGVPDAIDLDDDNDGIPDTAEGLVDSDGDGQPDYLDLDSDNDGVADIVEVNAGDTDNNYMVDNFIDNNNNGLSDELELFPLELLDSDFDRVADYLDLDSDNDGLTDLLESGGEDSDNNGRIDEFADSNQDGADDANQATAASGRDTDGDGVPNRLDLDTDNDGLFDLIESGASDELSDGILDSMQDIDQDGIPDSIDVSVTQGIDADSDGIDDLFDVSFVDGPDTDNDGIVDSADPDADGDGFADDVVNNPALGQALPDTNGNGEADVLEPAMASPEGNIRTGLQGYGGCSVSNTTNGKVMLDPMFVLLILASFAYLRRRSGLNFR